MHLVEADEPQPGRREAGRGASTTRRIEILGGGEEAETPIRSGRTLRGEAGRPETPLMRWRTERRDLTRVSVGGERPSHAAVISPGSRHPAAEWEGGPGSAPEVRGRSDRNQEPRRRGWSRMRVTRHRRVPEADQGRAGRETFPAGQVRRRPSTGGPPRRRQSRRAMVAGVSGRSEAPRS